MFGRVAIAQSSLDELARWRSRFDHKGDEPRHTLAYLNGEYVRLEISASQLKSTFDAIDRGIQALRNKLEVLPAVVPEHADKVVGALLRVSEERLLDPAYIARHEQLLLVSDDIRYRQLVSEALDVKSTWLQPILMCAKKLELLEIKHYGEVLVGLAAAKHGYLSVDRDTLLSVAEHDDTPGMERLGTVSYFIGEENADFASNYNCAWGFLSLIWGKPPLLLRETGAIATLPHLRRAAATGIMLSRLADLFARTIGLEAGFLRLHGDASGLARSLWMFPLSSYIRDWLIGHFIFWKRAKH
jgi:hypothetical protein